MKVGFLINPISGLGGSVGFKGTDGAETARRAIEKGAEPQSGNRALLVLIYLSAMKEEFTLYTVAGAMGEDIVARAGMDAVVLEDICAHSREGILSTGGADTVAAAAALEKCGVDLLLFAGGDGTARNVMDGVGTRVTVIGIPAGVKMHSGVFALNPRSAAQLAGEFIQGNIKKTEECEVMDIDEDAFRHGRVSAALYGYMRIPLNQKRTQGGKVSNVTDAQSAAGIASTVVGDMVEDCLYIVGPGSTTAAVMRELGLPNTLLGVDLVKGGRLVNSDVGENDILNALENENSAKIIVTPIGGQACLFGRGNQQLSPAVLRRVGKENIIIVATRSKLNSFYGNSLMVDTGDEETDHYLSGHYRVVVAGRQETVLRVGTYR